MSILSAAESDMNYTLTLKIELAAGTTIIRNIYECFRMLGAALLVAEGIESSDHLLPIKELMKLKVQTNRPIRLLDNLRRIRHNINYYGYKPSIADVEDAISYSNACFKAFLDKVKESLK